MKCSHTSRAAFLTTCLLITFPITTALAQAQGAETRSNAGSALSIAHEDQIQPDALQQLLKNAQAEKPLILQVGSHVLYAEAHIPSSEYAGPGSTPAGLRLLHDKLAAQPHSRFIVLYCGCCPWDRCPNIQPAFAAVRQMGFTHVKVLYLANNFGADWDDKGYAVEKGR